MEATIRLLPDTFDAIRRWPTDNARDWLIAFVRAARRGSNVISVVAVGSTVRSEVPSEDLDLVVVCRDRGRFKTQAPVEVDLRTFDIDEIDAGLAAGQDLLAWAVRYGAPLFDPERAWEDFASRWRAKLPLPDPKVARQRAATAASRMQQMRALGDGNAASDLRVSYLTHLARASIAEAGVFPASRPELPDQLREIGEADLAERLQDAIEESRGTLKVGTT